MVGEVNVMGADAGRYSLQLNDNEVLPDRVVRRTGEGRDDDDSDDDE
jgi:hypothetical protein